MTSLVSPNRSFFRGRKTVLAVRDSLPFFWPPRPERFVMSFSLTVSIPCIRGHFGRESLHTFQTQVKPEEINNLLGHDPRPQNWRRLPKEIFDLYSKIQRKPST